jgi:LacI family transcriptional regulator
MERELQFLSRIADRQIDGALLLTNHPGTPELAERISRLRHVVLLDEDVPGATVPRVFADNAEGGRLVARHLFGLKHQHLAFVGGPAGMLSVEERLQGFQSVFADQGQAVDPAMILRGPFSDAFGREAFRVLSSLPRPPTAIFAGADVLAFGIMRAARAAGVRIPGDLSIASFDDTPLNDLIDPPLTAIRQSPAEFGRRGVRLLVGLMRGAAVDDVPQRVPVELVVRGSAAEPPEVAR